MTRGGKRPGAGAKPGNLNAIKTGKHSRRVNELLDNVPEGFVLMTPRGGIHFIRRAK